MYLCKYNTQSNILRRTAEALCFSTADYACRVWNRSWITDIKLVNVALRETCRIITGCIWNPLGWTSYSEWQVSQRQMNRRPTTNILKGLNNCSVNDISYITSNLQYPGLNREVALCSVHQLTQRMIAHTQFGLGHLEWKTWRTLNRIRTGVAYLKADKVKWGLLEVEDDKFECGEVRNMEQLCPRCPTTCSLDDLRGWWTDAAVDTARYWAENFYKPQSLKRKRKSKWKCSKSIVLASIYYIWKTEELYNRFLLWAKH